MAMAIGLNISWMVSVQQPTQLSLDRARPARSGYKPVPPTVSFARPSTPPLNHHRLSFNHAVKPISALAKENDGYCFGSGSVWDFPNAKDHKDNKFKCCWNKDGDFENPTKKKSVTFDDVKGVDAAKTELLKIVSYIKGDNKYIELGVNPFKGVLLTGPPGTGKTLLARAMTAQVGESFFSISSSELVDQDCIGGGATRVRDLFREARKNSPSIIFIDEIDVVGAQRGPLHCERHLTLIQLLIEMDGFEKEGNVVVIGATNKPKTLDPALLRPGRLISKVVRVNVPDESGRKDILAHYLKDVPMEENKEDISVFVASITPGLAGADLENIVRESVLLATKRGGELAIVREDDIFEAVNGAMG